jgi:integrase
MVKLQRLTGMRPCEVFAMRVVDIDTASVPGIWLYRLASHKTQKKIGKRRVIALNATEQALISPYLIGKNPTDSVFNPKTAMAERNAEKRANRKTKITPSQAERDKARAAKPSRYREFYDENTYRKAIVYAIKKGNKILPEGEKIPHWYPYQLRHSASTATELSHSGEDAQALLGHKHMNTTKHYTHTQLIRREGLARNRQNPFETEGGE